MGFAKKRRLASICLLTLLALIFSGCSSNKKESSGQEANPQSVIVVGTPTKQKYSNLDEAWDFDGINVSVAFDNEETKTLPITDKSVTFTFYPEGPFHIKEADKGNLYIYDVKYTNSNGKSVIAEKSYSFKYEFDITSKNDLKELTIANMAALFFVPFVVFAFIVLFKRGEPKKL